MTAAVVTIPNAESRIARTKAGDRHAFAEIVSAHESMVFSIAWRYVANGAAAEDLAQEVFLELFQNLARIESDEHLVRWLRQVASRKCIDHLRRQRLRPRLALEDVPEPAASEKPADPLLRNRLEQMVASLPAKMRMAVVLRFQEEMEPAEIAAAMEMPVASVKSVLHRGLDLLRSKMRHCGAAS